MLCFFFGKSMNSLWRCSCFVGVHPHWIYLFSCFLALGWLIPNHFSPWSAFHQDAWVALASVIAGAPLFLQARGSWSVSDLGLFLGLLVLIPGLQWASGLVALPGSAWISCAYLLGFCLVAWCGARWEQAAPGQVLDGLFLAIGIAALLSVWIQLRQWLQLDDGWEWWSMGKILQRPPANFAQPNQAATFLGLGLGAVAWGAWRGHIRWGTGCLAAAYLLFGIALTGSRTAWLGLGLVTIAVWHWRRIWPAARTPLLISGLFLFLLFCIGLQASLPIGQFTSKAVLSTSSASLRLDVWLLALDAIALSPWVGYGWNQTALAQLRALDAHPSASLPFYSAHNLFLDLLVWCGIPLGAALSVAVLVWLVRRFLAVRRPDQAVLMLLVLLIFNHSMLEYPLHYAYLLLPLGWLLGALEGRIGGDVSRWFKVPRAMVIGLYLSAATLLGLIIADYFPIELAYRSLKLERERIQTAPWTVPDALVISHLSRHLEMVRGATTQRLSEADLLEREQLTEAFPDGYAIFYLAVAEALNQRPDQAVLWLKRYCKLKPADGCVYAAKKWAESGVKHPEIAAIEWPVKSEKAARP